MLYRFKSRAAADVVMVEAHGARVLEAMGREPAPQGIVTVAQMPEVIARLQAAIGSDDALRTAGAAPAASANVADDPQDEDVPARESVGLRQRAWPMLDLLQRSLADGADVVWGV